MVSLYDPRGTHVEADLRALGVPLQFLGKRRGPDPRMVPRLARAIAGFAPDVVHTHGGNVLRYVFPSQTPWSARPVVHTIHSLADRETDPFGQLLGFVAFRLGVAPVAIGQAAAQSIRRVYRLEPRRIIPNGIPVKSFAAVAGAGQEVRDALAIPPGALVLLTMGRLEHVKAHANLLEAFASERLRALGAHLLLAGEGELREELIRRARERGLGGRVHFLGNRSDVPRLLAAADLFVLASHYEGNPLSVMEAMAAGKPVVATAVGCVPELVPEGCGLLVPPGDPAALERAIHAIASDPALAAACGAAAAQVAHARFEDEVMADAYAELYAELA